MSRGLGDVYKRQQLSKAKRKQPDPEISGLYMIKELAHYFDAKGSYTKLKIVRDTFGRK